MSEPHTQRTQIGSLEEIVSELVTRGILPQPLHSKTLSGGSSSDVTLLECAGQRYVIKSNEPHILQSEATFLRTYSGIELFSPLHYEDPEHRFLLYPFIPGEVGLRKDKQAVLTTLSRQVINRYQPMVGHKQWGYLDEPVASWGAFRMNRIREVRKIIGHLLPDSDHELLIDLVEKRSLTEQPAYLLHGDLGVHNFIFQNGQFAGIIDPTPVVGPPIYDLVYAFCSSPDDLHPEVIRSAAAHLTTWTAQDEDELRAEVLLGLYSRIATCIKWHPEDWPAYQAAWQRSVAEVE